ncbi:hypothetical protein M422DRAFT_195238 [Sphaerobolus stellatus SS14]|uniref:CxC2-like cysteine cluster KDZ transposase-associated domain-containing protein n=1 Tax=Sphaerobolus stellatus (strain SS14) TaxID=990650 RepID=A0A0C9UEY1_SPHS4|nr:hypothetical protein M422DRAFT_195238 [Sphaerobolus stellatus SS14]
MDTHLATGHRAGLIAMPCLACPEPGFNLDPNWKKITPKELSYINRLHISQDANFRNQLRKKTKHNPEDFSLFDGRAYYPPERQFQDYLTTVVDSEQVCRFDTEYPQVQAHTVSGIMAAVCRHDCFRPGGQNDLQRGEKSANADYALHGALTWVPIPDEVTHTYDIVCQYSKKIHQRWSKHFPQDVSLLDHLIHAIPKKHIVGHIEGCQIRYSCNHLEGFGHVYGEGIEAIWSEDNQQSSSLREMNAGCRHEVTDDNHLDWNARKIQRLCMSISLYFLHCYI